MKNIINLVESNLKLIKEEKKERFGKFRLDCKIASFVIFVKSSSTNL